MIRRQRITATALISAVLARADEYRSLNAYITMDEEGARIKARDIDQRIASGGTAGRLPGVPLIVKDNIEVAGLPNTAGTPALRNFVPQQNAPVVQSLIDQGAIILGKANMHELAMGTTSNNQYFGAVGNPYKSDYFAGGSSGGTATAVAARMAVAGLGTDTGGSVRIPASFTGIYGFRASINRYSRQGITPISHSRDTAGPMARSITDLILLDAVLCAIEPDYAPADPSTIRLGVPRAYFYENLDKEIIAAVEGALERVEAAGIGLVEADLPGVSEIESKVGFPLAIYEAKQQLPGYLREKTQGAVSLSQLAKAVASPDVVEIMRNFIVGDKGPSLEDYAKALKVALPTVRTTYREYFAINGVDAMIFPTMLTTARPIAGSDEFILLNGKPVPTFLTNTHNTAPGSIAGVPGVSLPAGMSAQGLPIGMAIDGPYQSDLGLLKIALTLEQILADIPPPQENIVG